MHDLKCLWSLRSTPLYWWKWSHHRASGRRTAYPESLKIIFMADGLVRTLKKALSYIVIRLSRNHKMKGDRHPWDVSLRGLNVSLHLRTSKNVSIKRNAGRDRHWKHDVDGKLLTWDVKWKCEKTTNIWVDHKSLTKYTQILRSREFISKLSTLDQIKSIKTFINSLYIDLLSGWPMGMVL